MITALHRFHGYNGLKAVYRTGLTVRSNQASLKFAWRAERKPYRAAVVVSRKVHKSAVVRNRIRRRVFEVIRLEQAIIPGGLDMVILIYSEDTAQLSSDKLQDLIVGMIRKAIDQKPHIT